MQHFRGRQHRETGNEHLQQFRDRHYKYWAICLRNDRRLERETRTWRQGPCAVKDHWRREEVQLERQLLQQSESWAFWSKARGRFR